MGASGEYPLQMHEGSKEIEVQKSILHDALHEDEPR